MGVRGESNRILEAKVIMESCQETHTGPMSSCSPWDSQHFPIKCTEIWKPSVKEENQFRVRYLQMWGHSTAYSTGFAGDWEAPTTADTETWSSVRGPAVLWQGPAGGHRPVQDPPASYIPKHLSQSLWVYIPHVMLEVSLCSQPTSVADWNMNTVSL